jgi:hypothetical protein
MLRALDDRVEELHRPAELELAMPDGMFDFLDSKLFAAASVGAITAVLCFVSGVGGFVGLLAIPPLVMLLYWLIFR